MTSSDRLRTARSCRRVLSRAFLMSLAQVALWAVARVSPGHAQEPRAACVDVNTAPAAQLERIIHIGPARAKQIVTLRSQDRFTSVDDLERVEGIAAGRLRDIRSQGLACVRAAVGSQQQEVATAVDLPTRSVDQDECIDINAASAEELDKITQIGPARAQQIILLRQQRMFASVRELIRVDGIGSARIKQIEMQGLACVHRRSD